MSNYPHVISLLESMENRADGVLMEMEHLRGDEPTLHEDFAYTAIIDAMLELRRARRLLQAISEEV